ncbi:MULTISPECIES: CoA-acylating methylmalonate-semialdehyde dehydrogenase [unclassified Corynebacterium]|uniref:CoA-acylating methylmalonate-semialdehyde dehydrogenase n=1 Tax=unclassified Corynebacterium TaxID=2624378 RepID=UPI0030B0022D
MSQNNSSNTSNGLPVVPHIIGGKEVFGGGGEMDVIVPATGVVRAKVGLADAQLVDDAVQNAAEAQVGWAKYSPLKRTRVLNEWVRLIRRDADKIARELSLEHGKTFTDAHGDLQRGLEVVEFSLGAPHLLKGEFSEGVGTGVDVHSVRQPLGVVAGITPFNFPAMIPLWKAGPALAAGNAFIMKPSEQDPTVPVMLAKLFLEAGGPAGVLNVVHGAHDAVNGILAHEDIKAVGFVGSTPVAQHVYIESARTGKRAQCFGGAKNHMIIMPDADLDRVVDALIGAAYGSAGERCMAISVAVPVGDEVADALRDRLKEAIADLKVGHSLDPEADYGPLITEAARDRVVRLIGEGEEAGADLVVDGRGRGADDDSFEGESLEGGFFVGPTLFDNVTTDMSIYKEEIFGPVLCIVRAKDYEEALSLPNDHEYGNGVAIFTRDGDTARDFSSRVEVGMIGVNVPIPVPVAFHTFGGWKRSGFGDLNQHGPDSFRFYTRTKTITQTWPKGPREGASFSMPILGE